MAKKKVTAEAEAEATAEVAAEAAVAAPAEESAEWTYTVEEVQSQLKPLSENSFVRFWQKIWRWWLGVWYGFCDKYPKASKLLQMAFFFIVFSEGVTIYQYIVMTFLPLAFTGMWATPFVWPAVALPWKDAAGNALNYAIFNEPAKLLVNIQDAETGLWKVSTLLASTPEMLAELQANFGDTYQKVVDGVLVGKELQSLQCAGLGNFIAFEIAVFTAQCINFPLQRNITYRSHGNPWWQAMWYFIGWVLVSIATNALWGIMNPLLLWWNWPDAIIGIIKTILTGGVSLVVFFFIFMVIFPDNNKMAKKARAAYEKLVAANASAEKIAKAEAKMNLWETKATKSNAEGEYFKAKSQVNAAVMKYNTFVKASEKANEEAQKAEEAAQAQSNEKATAKAAEAKQKAEAFPEKIENAFKAAVEAIKLRDEKQVAFEAAQAL